MFWINYQEAQEQEERRQELIEFWEDHQRSQEEREQLIREYIKIRNRVLEKNAIPLSKESIEYWYNNGTGRSLPLEQ